MSDDTTIHITVLPQIYHNCRRWAIYYRGRTARIQEAPDYGGERTYYVDMPAQRKGVCVSKPVEGFLSAQITAVEMIDNYIGRSDGQTQTTPTPALGTPPVVSGDEP